MLVALLTTALVASAPDPTPIPDSTRQLVVVTTADWSATAGTLRRYERAGGGWRAVGEPVAVAVGRSGLGWGRGLHGGPPENGDPVKAEGDGRATAGAFRLSAAFGDAEHEPTGLPYVQTGPDVECVDDPASGAYNLVLERTAAADWRSHEEMRRSDGLYRIGVVVAHNGAGVSADLVPTAAGPATVAGGGSCIFLHVWRGPGSTTAGCTAMPDGALQNVLAWLDAGAAPVLVQLPQSEADRLRGPWGLPE
jgi:D-alanyl-D-alanine dipeptidase